MFDRFIADYIKKGTSAEATISEKLDEAKDVAGGLEGQQKKYGIRFKLGGIVSRGQKLARSKLTKLF